MDSLKVLISAICYSFVMVCDYMAFLMRRNSNMQVKHVMTITRNEITGVTFHLHMSNTYED